VQAVLLPGPVPRRQAVGVGVCFDHALSVALLAEQWLRKALSELDLDVLAVRVPFGRQMLATQWATQNTPRYRTALIATAYNALKVEDAVLPYRGLVASGYREFDLMHAYFGAIDRLQERDEVVDAYVQAVCTNDPSADEVPPIAFEEDLRASRHPASVDHALPRETRAGPASPNEDVDTPAHGTAHVPSGVWA
jgi:hypothetical protein